MGVDEHYCLKTAPRLLGVKQQQLSGLVLGYYYCFFNGHYHLKGKSNVFVDGCS